MVEPSLLVVEVVLVVVELSVDWDPVEETAMGARLGAS
jgi:hypothetical protein